MQPEPRKPRRERCEFFTAKGLARKKREPEADPAQLDLLEALA
jgi:hypothetical protein